MSKTIITTSEDERISRATFDRRISKAKAIKIERMKEDHLKCEQCDKNEQNCFRLDCSHIISVKDCINRLRRPEVAYDVDNLLMHCEICHPIHENKGYDEHLRIYNEIKLSK